MRRKLSPRAFETLDRYAPDMPDGLDERDDFYPFVIDESSHSDGEAEEAPDDEVAERRQVRTGNAEDPVQVYLRSIGGSNCLQPPKKLS